MKNKLLIFFFLFFIFSNTSLSNEYLLEFQTEKIELIENGNKIIATNGKAISSDNDLILEAKNFEYNKKNNELKVFGEGSAEIKTKELIFQFDTAFVDLKKRTISTYGFVKTNFKNKRLLIQSDLLVYEKDKNLLFSKKFTTFKDQFNNSYQVQNFDYDLSKNLIKLKNLIYEDTNKNIFKTSIAFLNLNNGKLIGKDLNLNLYNSKDNKNEPRLKSKSFKNNDYYTEIEKGVFTNCKKRKDKCPPWKMSAEKIKHDKLKKQINYENAKLFLYDIPVAYFPKFFHPDPTVERQSGFLIPSFNSSDNSSNYFSLPYFLALSENKDLTFTPRIYSNNEFLFQNEFRQKNVNSYHISDISFYKNDKKNDNHLFYKYNKSINLKNFDNSSLKFKAQRSSNDTYLKKNKIKSMLIDDVNILENSFQLNLFNDDFSLDLETIAYENLSKNENDRYEYIIPRVNLSKTLNNRTKFDGSFYFKSDNLVRNYDTNTLETSNINDLRFVSSPKFTNSGFSNNYEFILKNTNSNSKNSKDFKDDENFYFSSLFQFNSSKPLIKKDIHHNQIIEPKMSLKIAPDHTKNYNNDENLMSVDQLYSINRINKNDTIEGGVSIAYGASYSLQDNKYNNKTFNFKFSNNLRLKENDDIAKSNQLNKKVSNFFTETLFSPNENIEIKYNNSMKNNLSSVSNETIMSKIKFSDFNFLIDYLNENSTADQNSYLKRTIEYEINSSNKLKFLKQEDKSTNLTEFYNLVYEYKNDCLVASINYNKNFYRDRDIKPEESIMFRLTIVPFGQASSPNLKN